MCPLRRFQPSASSRAPVAGARLPLVKLATLQSVVCARVPGLLGYPAPIHASSFPTDRDGLPLAPSPCILRSRVHPLVSFVLLQSSFEQSSARVRRLAASPRAPPLGSRPSSRHQHVESTVCRVSRTQYRSVLSVSRALDGLLLLVPCASISLRCRVQGSRSRGFLLRPGRTTSSVAATLAPLAPSPAGCPAPANVASTSGSSSRPESAVSGGVFKPARHPCPLLRFQLPRDSLQRPWSCRRTPSARGLVGAVLRVPRADDPQRLDQSLAFASVPRGSARPSFVAFESVALLARPIGSERSVATADANPYEHSACQPQRTLNLLISKFRIVLSNVCPSDRGVDNLRAVCVAVPATDGPPGSCAIVVCSGDTCDGSVRSQCLRRA